MNEFRIILAQITHWDREWYLPFQEFRSRLVIMMDKLLKILRTDPEYKNFTMDGQTIPIEDYLEVCPDKEDEIKKYVQEKRLSIGPMYILPDEFLISGESLIRNLMVGHKIAKKFGRVMKAGYIPDPFGHIAQLPQILSGFGIPSVLFARGFGNEVDEYSLNTEFIWNAPGNAASVLGIDLIGGYGNLADLDTKQKNGIYKSALRQINKVIRRIEKHNITPYVLLNSGSDHHEARPEIPQIIKQWNELNKDKLIEQNDFEYYINKILNYKPKLNSFQGELRGGKYLPILSGVLSTRMWIKQRNTSIEHLYEKYSEPISTIIWVLDKYNEFIYPDGYLFTGWKWLLKNHPHDSICGCSIDQVHEEMKTRFDWSEQIGSEIFKNTILYLSDIINYKNIENSIPLIVYNPLPWLCRGCVNFNIIVLAKENGATYPRDIKIIDNKGNEVAFQNVKVNELPRYTQEYNASYEFSFIAEVPACGYRIFYLIPGEKSNFPQNDDFFRLEDNLIENEYYIVKVGSNGQIDVFDKEGDVWYKNICELEDCGDWGDEYDFSGPKDPTFDIKFHTNDASIINISPYINGPTQKTLRILIGLDLPLSLEKNRSKRSEVLVVNEFIIYVTLYKGIKRIDFKIDIYNNCKDHRIRVLFPTNIKSEKVYADGHFYIVPRNINLPDGSKWVQKPLPTNHQKDFICIFNETTNFAVFNKGLPEYEAIKNKDGTVSLAITLLRCIEWLSRGDLQTRGSNAGPDLNTPSAQCLGSHRFELSLTINSHNLKEIDPLIPKIGKEFNSPLKPIFPNMVRTPLRLSNKLVLTPLGLLGLFNPPHKNIKSPYLPDELSFLEIDNDYIMLSALKKSEIDNHLIIRCYNLSTHPQIGTFRFYKNLIIKNIEFVNFLEKNLNNITNAKINYFKDNIFELKLNPHVITTIKLEFQIK
ncbi:MAG: alpha-mannosidase [Candidatus Helarchaeota archaeon]